MTNNNVRFTIQDDDDSESTPQQDPAELRRLKEMSLGETSLGNGDDPVHSNHDGGSGFNSRSASTTQLGYGHASRSNSKADINSRSHSRIHTPDISPPSTPSGDPGSYP